MIPSKRDNGAFFEGITGEINAAAICVPIARKSLNYHQQARGLAARRANPRRGWANGLGQPRLDVELPQMENAMVTGLSSHEQTDAPAAGGATFDYNEAFSRNIGLFTLEEQDKLRRSHVAIAGMGGVGGVHVATLARTGIGNFTIADPDCFELANMKRQYGAPH